MWQKFREFIARGNVMDLAIAVIIGAAFVKIVTSFRSFRPFSKWFVRNGAKPGIHSRREAQQLQNPLL